MKPRTYRWKPTKLPACQHRILLKHIKKEGLNRNMIGRCRLGHFLCNAPYCDDFQSPLSTTDHAQLNENLVDSQSDSATNSQEEGR